MARDVRLLLVLCVALPALSQAVAPASVAAAAAGKAVGFDLPPGAPPPDQVTTEDLARAVSDSQFAPPGADPRDFNGVWFPDHNYRDGPHERPQYLPGKAPVRPKLADGQAAASDSVLCIAAARFTGAGGGMVDLYVQTADQLVLFSEENADRREILIGVKHAAPPGVSVTGDSVAHWEGDTLVVDTVGLMNPDVLKNHGRRVANSLHVVERIRKVRNGHYLEHRVTYEDPARLVKPYTTTWGERWRPDMNIGEHVCEEGFDRFRIVDGRIVTTYADGQSDAGDAR